MSFSFKFGLNSGSFDHLALKARYSRVTLVSISFHQIGCDALSF
jgi:hypothetical protein